MKPFLTLIFLTAILSCQKQQEQGSTRGDEVVGSYSGSSASSGVFIRVYKIGNGTYAIRKISQAPFPEFTFEYNLDVLGIFFYKVPKQTVLGISISESSAVYGRDDKEFGFTLREADSTTSWTYTGYK